MESEGTNSRHYRVWVHVQARPCSIYIRKRVDVDPSKFTIGSYQHIEKIKISFLLPPIIGTHPSHHPLFLSFLFPFLIPSFLLPFFPIYSLLASQSPPYLQYFLCICQHNEIMIPLYYTMGA